MTGPGGPGGPGGPDDPDPPESETYTLTVSPDAGLTPLSATVAVQLPAGAGIDAAELRLLSPLQQTAPLGDAASADITTFQEGPMLVAAVLPSGEPVLLGWVDASSESHTLSARSTAEVFAWFDTGSHLLLDPLKPLMTEALRAVSELAPLEEAVGRALSSAPHHLEGAAASLNPVRQEAARAILASERSEDSRISTPRFGILVDPGDAVSGARVLEQGLDRIAVENNYRIRRVAYVDRVDPSPAEVTKIDLSPTTGVSSLAGAVTNIATSAIFDYDEAAYAGRTSEPVRVPMTPEDGERTEYQVTVIGPGASAGSAGQLSPQRTSELRRLIRETLILDFLMPIVNNVALPLVPEGTEMPFGENLETMSSMVEQIVNRMPGVIDKAYEGDMLGAAKMFMAGLAEDNAKDLIGGLADLIVNKFVSHTTEAAKAAAREQLKEGVGKLLKPLAIGDAILTSTDLSVQIAHIGSSARAETFDISVTPSTVNLLPETGTVNVTEELEFTATVPEAAGGDDAFEYRWSTSGSHGTIKDAVGHEGTEFNSSRDQVTYVPEGSTTGEDVVIVEVYQIHNQDRIRVGADTSTVRVTDIEVTITPSAPTIRPGEMVEFTATVDPMPEGTLYYRWTTSGNHGTTFPESGTLGFSWLQYTARDNPENGAEDWVEVEVFADLTDQTPTGPPLAKARVTVEIDETVIHGSLEVRTQSGQTSRTTCFALVAIFPMVEGATEYRITTRDLALARLNSTWTVRAPFQAHDDAACASYGWGGTEGNNYVWRLTSGSTTNPDNIPIHQANLNGFIGAGRVEARPRF